MPHFGDRALGTMRVGDYPPTARAATAGSAMATVGKITSRLRRNNEGEANRGWTVLLSAAALLGFLVLMWRVARKR